MPFRVIRRGATLAVALALVVAGLAFADTAPADADTVTAGVQGSRHLGSLAPGATTTVSVGVTLRCGNGWHAERGSTIVVDAVVTAPLDGGAVVAPGTIGPVPNDWPLDGEYCPGGSGSPSLAASAPVAITITAPSAVGTGYEYPVLLTFSPDTGISGLSAVTFTLDVVAPTPVDTKPPVLDGVPAGVSVVTTDPAGAAVFWAAPTATDETDPAPVVSCAPASGSVFPVGTTTVVCTASDASGNSASASFPVSVALVTPTAAWGEPLGAGSPALVANHGRVVPLKVDLALDGAPVLPGGGATPALALDRLAACGGAVVGSAAGGALAWVDGRWTYRLDTGSLGLGCWRVTVLVDGTAYGTAEILVVPAPAGQAGALRGRSGR